MAAVCSSIARSRWCRGTRRAQDVYEWERDGTGSCHEVGGVCICFRRFELDEVMAAGCERQRG